MKRATSVLQFWHSKFEVLAIGFHMINAKGLGFTAQLYGLWGFVCQFYLGVYPIIKPKPHVDPWPVTPFL